MSNYHNVIESTWCEAFEIVYLEVATECESLLNIDVWTTELNLMKGVDVLMH